MLTIHNGDGIRALFGMLGQQIRDDLIAPITGLMVLLDAGRVVPPGSGLNFHNLYQGALMKTHRDGLPGLSARSVRRGDAGYRETCATPSESPGNFSPARRAAYAISMGLHQRSLVLGPVNRFF